MATPVRIIKKILLALIIFAIFGEWALRLFKCQLGIYYPAGRTFPPIFAESDVTTIKLKPNTDVTHYNYCNEFVKRYYINAKGLRGRTEDGDIVMMGDSFIFGMGLDDDETVPYLLEEETGRKVINAGVPGYSVDDVYVSLRGYDRTKTVIVGFFLGNDMEDIAGHEWIDAEDGLPKAVLHKGFRVDSSGRLTASTRSAVPPLIEFLRNNSFFYTILSENRYKLKWKIASLVDRFKEKASARRGADAPSESGFKEDETAVKIKRLFQGMKNEHGRLLVLIIPSRAQKKAEAEFLSYITGFFDKERIDYLRLPDAPGSLFYKKDCHWTPLGARLAALLIHKKLDELCWL